MTRIGIIGEGNVGSALARGLKNNGNDVRTAGKDPEKVADIGKWADTLFLAVPFGERQNALQELGEVEGKTLIDVTNALDENMEFVADPIKESGAEELQRLTKGARVVKAFNTVFAQHMDKGNVDGEKLTVLVAGDDETAKETTMALAENVGFDVVDAGPLQNARWLETLGYFNIQMGYVVGHGTDSGFKFVHPKSPHGKVPVSSAQAS